jgi:hypothetical protein
MVYGLYRALPGDRLSCHRRWQIIANLTPASRRQDHTSSPSASAPFVCVLGPKPNCADAAASTAARPVPVTIASRPSVWDGTVWI